MLEAVRTAIGNGAEWVFELATSSDLARTTTLLIVISIIAGVIVWTAVNM